MNTLSIGNLVDAHARRQAHVLQRTGHAFALYRILEVLRRRHAAVDAGHHLGRGAPGHLRHDRGSIDVDHGIEFRVGIRDQRMPAGDRLVPVIAPWARSRGP
jgi:hypothetical protein